jgi:hypothetical protein
MKHLTVKQHRERINNLRDAERDVIKCFKQYRIKDYLPGQAVYNLGDYPAPFSIEPTEYDYSLLKKLADYGISLIQVHEEWNDAIRMHGADKYDSHDPEGMKKFIDLCHYFGIKIISYLSSSYIHSYDLDFREEFTRCDDTCTAIHHNYRVAWAGSPEWREFILRKTFAVLDKYEFDGLFNDMAYDSSFILHKEYRERGEKFSGISYPYDMEVEDLIFTIYSEIKKRGGIYKLHSSGYLGPPCKEKVYDYLWVGEGIRDKNKFALTKLHEPYVVPAVDNGHLEADTDPDYIYVQSIPFMQFPLLMHGRPLTGRSVEVEGVKYYGCDDPKSEYNMKKRVGEYYRAHPQGPYTYTEWGSIPDDPNEIDRWGRYLQLYLPMVTENSVVHMAISESPMIKSDIAEDVYISLFTNEKQYLVVSNTSDSPYTLITRDEWVDRETRKSGYSFFVPNGKIVFLVKKGHV